MTSTGLSQLIAYLKALAAKNQGENVQTDTQSTEGSQAGSLAQSLAKPAIKAGIKYGLGAASAGAGESSLGSLGGANWGAYAPYLSLLMPAYMTWSAYTKGSGRNDPLTRLYQTQGAGKMLSDILGGKKVDPNTTYQDYFVPEKRVQGMRDPRTPYGGEDVITPGTELIDPRGYSPNDLYHFMHQRGAGNQSRLDTDSSGLSDAEIDRRTGLDRGALSKAIGEEVPDWATVKYADYYSPGTDKQKALDTEWAALEAQKRQPYEQQAAEQGVRSSYADLTTAQQLWQKMKDKEELEKLLGYRL